MNIETSFCLPNKCAEHYWCRPDQQHTAHQHPSEATIHYRFHPGHGQRVTIIRRHRFRGEAAYVVEQPDGSLTQLPTWMTEPAAALLRQVTDPLLPIQSLLELRRLVDVALPSRSIQLLEGDERDATRDPPVRSVPKGRFLTAPADSGRGSGLRATGSVASDDDSGPGAGGER